MDHYTKGPSLTSLDTHSPLPSVYQTKSVHQSTLSVLHSRKKTFQNITKTNAKTEENSATVKQTRAHLIVEFVSSQVFLWDLQNYLQIYTKIEKNSN